MSKNLDEIVRFLSKKRREWIRETKGRLLAVAKGMSSALHLANSLARFVPREKRVFGDPL